MFAESGLLAGFFLPGDTLLITAGILASQGHLNIALVIIVALVGAILGDSTGYLIGKQLGPRLFKKRDSRFFSQKRLKEGHEFFERYGAQSIILARFIPIVRTMTPTVAGSSGMNYRAFLIYNVIGGLLWTVIVSLLGFGLGNVVPNIDHYILPVIIVISLISLAPAFWHAVRQRKAKS